MLVEEVVDTTRAAIAAADLDYASLLAGSVPDREIWTAAGTYPSEPAAPRLVVVRDCDRVKSWAPLERWFEHSRKLPTVHLLFVSGASDFARLDKSAAGSAELVSHLSWIRDASQGQLVRCSSLSEDDAVAWVHRHCPGTSDVDARYLLTRVGGSLVQARSVCLKSQLFGGQLSSKVIDMLCSAQSDQDFVDDLIKLNKPLALTSAPSIAVAEVGRTIGLLDSRLDLLATLYSAIRARMTARDISIKLSVPVFLIHKYLSVAKHYDSNRVRACRQALAIVDDAQRSGARDGVLELLVMLW